MPLAVITNRSCVGFADNVLTGSDKSRNDGILLVVHVAVIHFGDQFVKAAHVHLRLLQMGLERLFQLLVARMFDHAFETLNDLVLRR